MFNFYIFNPPHIPKKLTVRGENFLSLKTHLLAPRQSGFWIGCLDALKLPKRCEKVAVIRRWALWGGCCSWDEGIVGMWRLLKVNRCWESSRCREKTIFKTLGAAVPQKKIDRWYQHQQNMKFLRWWNWKFMRWSWMFQMLILTVDIIIIVVYFAEWMRVHNSKGLASTKIKKTWVSGKLI